MTDTFERGEVAIAQNLATFPEDNGLEVTVISGLRYTAYFSLRTREDYPPAWGYDVRWPDNMVTFQLPSQLRKKRPPGELKREDVGEWDLCPWQPARNIKQPVSEGSVTKHE